MQILKYKKNFTHSYSLGATLTFELIKNKPNEIIEILVNDSTSEEILNDLKKLQKIHNFNIVNNKKAFNILSDKENCYVIGVFKKFNTTINNNEPHICLVNPGNSGNLGTIIRSSLGFNVRNIAIITPAVDHFDPKTIRSSMGAIFNLNIELFNSFEEYQNKFNNYQFFPFVLKGKNDLRRINFNNIYDHTSLVFGNEQTGLPTYFEEMPNTTKINHSNNIDSLNLAEAVNIALYQLTNNIKF